MGGAAHRFGSEDSLPIIPSQHLGIIAPSTPQTAEEQLRVILKLGPVMVTSTCQLGSSVFFSY